MRSLRSRVTLTTGAALLLAAVGSVAFFYWEAYRIATEIGPRTLRGQTGVLSSSLIVNENGDVSIRLPESSEEFYRAPETFAYTLYDANRRPVVLSPNIQEPLPAPADFDRTLTNPQPSFFGVVGLPGVAGSAGHVLVVSRRSFGGAQAALLALIQGHRFSLLFWLAAVLLLIPVMWKAVDWHFKSVRRVSQAAAAITDFGNPVRVNTDGLGSEIVPIVDAFNGALDRLARSYQRERDFSARAAHELRTPFAVLDFRLQRAELNGVVEWSALRQELAQFRNLLDQLLKLARNEHLETSREVFHLSRAVWEAAESVLPLVEREGRKLEIDEPGQPIVLGHKDALSEMVRNLLENALIHGAGQVTVTVRAATNSDFGRSAVIEVFDEGPGVSDADKELVFDRFRKVGKSAAGAGLGLAIVREIVEAHGGTVSFVPSIPMCCVRVILPAMVPRSRDTSQQSSLDPQEEREPLSRDLAREQGR